jgi:hypothetical protein
MDASGGVECCLQHVADQVTGFCFALARETSSTQALRTADPIPPESSNNLWMLFNALAENARRLTPIVLYNSDREPDGPGGAAHPVRVAERWGFKSVELDARELLKT